MLAVVAPHAGAWIETTSAVASRLPVRSLLMQERGLKPYLRTQAELLAESLLMQERGLKRSCNLSVSTPKTSLLMQERGLKPNQLELVAK